MTKEEAVSKLIAWCKAQIGYHEGTDNWNKYAAMADVTKLLGWDAQKQPWCDIFTDAGFVACFGLKDASEMTYQPIGRGSAACRYSAQFFKDHGAFVQNPEAGDVVFFFDSEGVINHQGIVEKVSGGVVHTIEGNKSDKVDRWAYAVGSKTIAGYGRPKWSVVAKAEPEKPAPPAETPVTEGYTLQFRYLQFGCEGEDVRALQRNLKSLGFDVGRYGLDGDFGNDTKKAVVDYQRSVRLDPDGIVGPDTMSALCGLK